MKHYHKRVRVTVFDFLLWRNASNRVEGPKTSFRIKRNIVFMFQQLGRRISHFWLGVLGPCNLTNLRWKRGDPVWSHHIAFQSMIEIAKGSKNCSIIFHDKHNYAWLLVFIFIISFGSGIRLQLSFNNIVNQNELEWRWGQ